jgi:hypothetical protein
MKPVPEIRKLSEAIRVEIPTKILFTNSSPKAALD